MFKHKFVHTPCTFKQKCVHTLCTFKHFLKIMPINQCEEKNRPTSYKINLRSWSLMRLCIYSLYSSVSQIKLFTVDTCVLVIGFWIYFKVAVCAIHLFKFMTIILFIMWIFFNWCTFLIIFSYIGVGTDPIFSSGFCPWQQVAWSLIRTFSPPAAHPLSLSTCLV